MNLAYLEEISKFKGWDFKGFYSNIAAQIDTFSFSFILAVSETHFWGIMANSGSNSSDIFLYLWIIYEAQCKISLNEIMKLTEW